MNCPKCNGELRIGAEQVGLDKDNLPIFHRFAYCDVCRLKKDLDLQEEKKPEPEPAKKDECPICGGKLRIGTEQVGVDEHNLPVFHRFAYCDTCMRKKDIDLKEEKKNPEASVSNPSDSSSAPVVNSTPVISPASYQMTQPAPTQTEIPYRGQTVVNPQPAPNPRPMPSPQPVTYNNSNGNKKSGSFVAGFALFAVLLIVGFKILTMIPGMLYSEEAQNVDTLISQIGEVGVQSDGKIKSARDAYNALPDKDKKQVKNLGTLETAEQSYVAAVDAQEAAKIDAVIDKIGQVTIEKGSVISDARAAYEGLSEERKTLVSKYDVLEKAEQDYISECEKAASEIDDSIVEIANALVESKGEFGEEITASLDQIEKKYNLLPDDVKSGIANKEIFDEISGGYSEYKISVAQEAINHALKKKTDYEAAEKAYAALSLEETKLITGYPEFNEELSDYKFKKTRQEYADQCEAVSYDDLRKYPDTYKGKKIKITVTIEEAKPDGWIFQGDIIARMSGKELAVNDKRTVREPRFVNGDKVTIYGVGDGLARLKTYEKGTGLLGTDFLADTVEDKEIPSVNVTYTDKDIFRRTDSSATIDTKSVDINEELNASDEVWDERQKKAGEAGKELAEKLNEFFEQ